jgi:GNAT superfamily N-acetyltransferase
MLTIRQIEGAGQIAAAQALVREYFDWFFALAPGSETAPTFNGWQEELETIPGHYLPPMERFLLASFDGQAVGCIVLKRVNSHTCELKRLFVHPTFRGRDIGRELVKAFLREARVCGYQRAVLDSHISMVGAHAIYQQLGFDVVTAPADFPQEFKNSVVFMRLDFDQ